MFTIGCHLSSGKGFLRMGREAVRIGANTFQFFTRNPRGGAAKALNPDDLAAYASCARDNGISRILAHASYTLNPAAAEGRLRDFFLETAADDLDRLAHLPGSMYNLHPGSFHTTPGDGIKMVAANLDAVIPPGCEVTVLLETMTGKGRELGGTFGELRAIIDLCGRKKHLGVCLDTCHVFDAGYDIARDLDGVLKEFDRAIGLDRLRAVHLNDSKNPLGGKKDRHAKIGEGSIGVDGFRRIVNHPSLRELPFYLETPNDVDGYAAEIAALKELRGKD